MRERELFEGRVSWGGRRVDKERTRRGVEQRESEREERVNRERERSVEFWVQEAY